MWVIIYSPPLLGCWTNQPLLPRIYSWVFFPLYLEYICGTLPLLGCWTNHPLLPRIYIWVFCPLYLEYICGYSPFLGCWTNHPLLPRIYSWLFCPLYLEYVCGYVAPLWMLDEASLITLNIYVGILPLFGCWMKCPLLPRIYSWCFAPFTWNI